ncbi:MAG: ATP-binding protein [Thaumarchaeota archaeon]|nr:ATP-binding protein [Nitrososphaerota archaeon]
MTLWEYVSIREDVFDRSLDDKLAPSLAEVVFKEAHEIYVDPERFVNITYPTETLKRLLEEVLNAFASKVGRVIILPSAFGGGKTHIMILLYHLLKNPALLSRVLGDSAKVKQHILEGATVVVIDGTDKRTAPSPIPGEALEVDGVKIRTLWGYLAYKLGAYDKVRTYDESSISPESSTLLGLFAGKKVLILIDEIGLYYNRIARGPPELSNYADQVVVFLRMLTEAVSRKDVSVIVVISLPAEPTREGLRAEPGYEIFVEKIEREVARRGVIVEKPIATDEDFANILRRRLFSKIDERGGELASRKLRKAFVDYREHLKDVSEEVKKYYPFHPLFIAVLKEIVERNKDLQRTRDALKIARKVLRSLYSSVKELSLIMPTDIDLRVREIRTNIVTQSFMGFDVVVDKIISKAREIPVEGDVVQEVYRDLAYRVALYVFLRTYIYDPHLEPKSEFPSKAEAVTGVYDPDRCDQYYLSPVRISELLEKLAAGTIEYRVPHLYGRDGYYWVTRLLDIGERISKEAERVEDSQALTLILEEVEKLYSKPYDADTRGEVKSAVFASKPRVLLKAEPLEDDVAEYRVAVIVPPLENEREGVYVADELYDVVYYRLSGRQKVMKRFRNTTVVLFSNNVSKWQDVIKTAKMIIACDRLKETISREYRDEKVIKLLKDELKEHRGNLLSTLKYKLVTQYFNLVAYPDMEKDTRVVRVVQSGTTGKTLVELVEEALRNSGKVLDERYASDFEVLVRILEGRKEAEEVEWSKTTSVRDVVNAFFENSAYPMIPPKSVKKALLSGLRSLKIGVKRDDKVYFKKVEGVGELASLEDTDMVIPAKEAAEKQLEELSKEIEEIEEDTIVRYYYVAVYGGKEIPLKELKQKYPENYIKVFIESDIKLRKERISKGFTVYIEPSYAEFKLDEVPDNISVKVLVRRVGPFSEEVTLTPDVGRVELQRGLPDFSTIWIAPVPREPGDYVYKLVARGAKLVRETSLRLVVKRGLICRAEPYDRVVEIVMRGEIDATVLVEFLRAVEKYIKGQKLVKQCKLKVEHHEKGPEKPSRLITVDFEDALIDDVVNVSRALSNVLGLTARIINIGDVKIEVKGDGVVENVDELKSVSGKIIKERVSIEYCW